MLVILSHSTMTEKSAAFSAGLELGNSGSPCRLATHSAMVAQWQIHENGSGLMEKFQPQKTDSDDSRTGIRVNFTRDSHRLDYLNFIWNNTIHKLIVRESNRYYYCMQCDRALHARSRVRQWYDLEADEIKTFLLIVLLKGMIKKKHYRD